MLVFPSSKKVAAVVRVVDLNKSGKGAMPDVVSKAKASSCCATSGQPQLLMPFYHMLHKGDRQGDTHGP